VNRGQYNVSHSSIQTLLHHAPAVIYPDLDQDCWLAMSAPMNWVVSWRSSSIVSRARCAGALLCWKTGRLHLPQCLSQVTAPASATCLDSYCSARWFFGPGSTKLRLVQPNFYTATETITDLLKVERVRRRRLALMSRFSCQRCVYPIISWVRLGATMNNLSSVNKIHPDVSHSSFYSEIMQMIRSAY